MIDRQELIKHIEEKSGMNIPEWLRETIEEMPEKEAISKDDVRRILEQSETRSQAMEMVDAMPSIEPKKGKWIHKPELGWGETWICSECGEKTTSTIMGEPRYEWCPMCGADMRQEGEEHG